ncbi:MAG: RNA 2'-phosphotransferase [Bacteroidia bacterium]
MRGTDYKKLSKTIAHALRHDPSFYGLVLDNEGWAELQELVEALRGKYNRWETIDTNDVLEMNHLSYKQRFEIKENKIRALYGHSADVKVEKIPVLPPEQLFHGTSTANAALILSEGLQAMDRQYVHLSADRKTAWYIGKRKTDLPVILMISAREAEKSGVHFYFGNDTVWLADSIPNRFIHLES